MIHSKQTQSQVIDDLRRQLEALEASSRASSGEREAFSPCGIEPLNAVLRGGGFRNGTMVEWLAEEEGSGVVTAALVAAAPWLEGGQTCVIIDEKREFCPAFMTAWGIGLEQTLLVRPDPKDALWALEQALLCRGVAVTAGWLDQVSDRVLRRLQLAAETGGGMGMLFRPMKVQAEPTWASLRLLVRPLSADERGSGVFFPWSPGSSFPNSDLGTRTQKHRFENQEKRLPTPFEENRHLRIEVLYCQGGKSGTAVEVEINHETGDVRMVPSLASPRDSRQAT